MKTIIIFFLIGLALSYNPSAAVSYAKAHCRSYNSNFNNYKGNGGDCANFVCQCLIAGGIDIKNQCKGHYSYWDGKCIVRVRDIRSCLSHLGWKYSKTLPSQFKAGYPMVHTDGSHTILAVSVSGKSVRFAGHTTDYCDQPLSASVYYYYLP